LLFSDFNLIDQREEARKRAIRVREMMERYWREGPLQSATKKARWVTPENIFFGQTRELEKKK
jgi:hypothetical protein